MAPAAPFFFNVNLVPLEVDLSDVRVLDEFIDYSDLEEKYSVPDKFSCILVIDGLPVIEETKREKFVTFLQKFFAKENFSITADQVYIPFNKTKNDDDNEYVLKSDGFLFLCCDTPNIANSIIKKMNNSAFTKTSSIMINKFMDIKHYQSIEPIWNELKAVGPEREHINRRFTAEWITNPAALEQLAISVLHPINNNSNSTSTTTSSSSGGVFCNSGMKHSISTSLYNVGVDAVAIAECEDGSEGVIGWSPRGNYMAARRRQGVRLMDGSSLERLLAFEHPGVQFFDFSPNETFLVTYSHNPLPPPPQNNSSNNNTSSSSSSSSASKKPWGRKSVGHNVLVWNVETEKVLLSFVVDKSELVLGDGKEMVVSWPYIKWSWDEKYFAVLEGAQKQLSIFESSTMKRFERQFFDSIINVSQVKWMPYSPPEKQEQQVVSESNEEGEKENKRKSKKKIQSTFSQGLIMPPMYSLAYYIPSRGSDKPAQLALLNVAKREYVRRIQLFHALRGDIQFSMSGEYLVFRVLRTNKSGKTFYTTVEIVRLREKDFPCDTVEIRAPVCTLELAPTGNHFAVITWDNPSGCALEDNLSDEVILREGFLSKMILTFYTIEAQLTSSAITTINNNTAANAIGGKKKAAASAAAIEAAAVAAAVAAAKVAAAATAAKEAEAKAIASALAAGLSLPYQNSSKHSSVMTVAPIIQQARKNDPIGICVAGSVKVLASFERRSVNSVHWSPKGRFAVAAGLRQMSGRLEFYDVDPFGHGKKSVDQEKLSKSVQTIESGRKITVTKAVERVNMLSANEHHGATNVHWDPSGRYVSSIAPSTGTRNSEGKYFIWSFCGTILNREAPGMISQVLWRPHPQSLLTASRSEKIAKNVQSYIREVEAKDREENEAILRTEQLRRQRRYNEFMFVRSLALMRLPGKLITEEEVSINNSAFF